MLYVDGISVIYVTVLRRFSLLQWNCGSSCFCPTASY